MRPGCSMTGPAPQSARTSAKRASSLQKLAGCSSDQAYSSGYSRSCVPRRAFTQPMKRVRFASAMRAGEGRHSSDIESSAVRDSSARFRAGRFAAMLQRLVVRPRAAFGCGPGDDLVRILDVAGLAVDAVGGVDLQPPPAVAVVHHLVDARRAEALARIAEFPGAAFS